MKASTRNLTTLLLLLLATGAVLVWWGRESPASPTKPPADGAIPTEKVSNFRPPIDTKPPTPLTESIRDAGEKPALEGTPIDPTVSLLVQIETALKTQTDADWDQVANITFPALVALDRAAALRLMENFPPGDKREQLLRRLVQAWAASDFAGAVTWIATLDNFAEQKAAFYDACFAAGEKNPAEAIHAWESFDFKDDDQVMANLVQSWAGKDLAAAQVWVGARPPSLQRDQAMARIAFVLAQTKPALAANLVIRELPPGPAQTEAIISIIQQWAKADLPGASTWVQQFPLGPLAERAKNELAGIAKYHTAAGPTSP